MAQATAQSDGFMERVFKLRENNTNVRTEVLAGVTTFMTMAYIIIVNPQILSDAGVPFEAAVFATCMSAAVATLLMAFLANYPFALAPGMGLNAYFAYSVVLGMGISWQTALGAVFISGVIFLIISVTQVREYIVNAVPMSLKSAIAAGIGLFIAFIGLQNGGLVVDSPATLVTIANIRQPEAVLTLIGLVVTGALLARNVRGAILIGMVISALIGIPMGLVDFSEGFFALPRFSEWAPTFGKLDIMGALNTGLLTIVFAFLFVDFFDTAGTLIGVSTRAGFLDERGRLPRAGRAFTADAIGTIFGSISGTPTVTTYVESTAGVAVGGRTGLTAVVVAVGFLLALFLKPLITALAAVGSITAPALILVGSMMVRSVLNVNWDDASDGIPAFIAMVAMPLVYSISEGISLGFIAYAVVKALAGKAKEVHWVMWVLAALFVLRYLFLM
jgi:AGZA family xanthine/uracil permease-like MFS transporter